MDVTHAQLLAMVQGANVLACTAIMLFFVRYWRTTGDRFFLWFAVAFALFAINRFALALVGELDERVYLYWVRLAGFLVIAVAIIAKNVGASRAESAPDG